MSNWEEYFKKKAKAIKIDRVNNNSHNNSMDIELEEFTELADKTGKEQIKSAARHVDDESRTILTKLGDTEVAKKFASTWKSFITWLNTDNLLRESELAEQATKWEKFQYYLHKLIPEQKSTKRATLLIALAALIGGLITIIKLSQHYHIKPKKSKSKKNRK